MQPDDIVSFWFGALDAEGLADATHAERWWRKDEAFDRELRARFESTWQAVMAGQHEDWLEQPESRLAYVVVLDQFSRNMFRGSGQSFSADARALAVAEQGIERGHDKQLVGHKRVFFYMPFMHSEQLSDQERCIALFRAFRDESSGRLREAVEQNVDFAIRHRDIIARFNRFPHRNQLLGRASTPEEQTFLTQPNSSF